MVIIHTEASSLVGLWCTILCPLMGTHQVPLEPRIQDTTSVDFRSDKEGGRHLWQKEGMGFHVPAFSWPLILGKGEDLADLPAEWR